MKAKVVLLLLLILAIVLSGCVSQESPERATTTPTTPTEQPPAPPSELKLKVGETAKTSKVQVTVIAATKQEDYEYYSDILQETRFQFASPGKTFVLVDAEIQNIGSDRIYVGVSKFSVSDSEGFRYDTELYLGNDGLPMFKELYQNQKVRGKVLFEVSENSTGLKILYDFGDLLVGTKLAIWELT